MSSLARRTIVVTLVVALAAAIGFVLVQGQLIVLTFFGAIVIGEAIRPFVNRLSATMPRAGATALSFIALVAVILILWLAPLYQLAPQFIGFWHDLPTFVADATAKVEHYSKTDPEHAKTIANLSATAASTLGPIAGSFFQAQATGFASLIGTLGLMLVMAAFWLGASESLGPFILSLVAPAQRLNVASLFDELGPKLGQYVTGTIVNGSIVAVVSIAFLVVLRTPYPVVFGLLQGLLIALPYLGTLIGVLVVGAVVLGTQGWTAALIAMLGLALIQSLEGTFVAPLIFKQGLGIDPLFTIVAIALGGALFGIVGVILAVPAAAAIQTIFVRVVAPAIRSSYGEAQ